MWEGCLFIKGFGRLPRKICENYMQNYAVWRSLRQIWVNNSREFWQILKRSEARVDLISLSQLFFVFTRYFWVLYLMLWQQLAGGRSSHIAEKWRRRVILTLVTSLKYVTWYVIDVVIVRHRKTVVASSANPVFTYLAYLFTYLIICPVCDKW